MKRSLLYTGVVLLGASLLWAMNADTPQKAVELFKRAADTDKLADMARLLTEVDGSGPLKEANLQKTMKSIEGLQQMWKGVAFEYSEPVTLENGTVQINVTAAALSQQIRFVLKKFGESWYILDIEIYVR
jgi:uncharacterized membrane protein YvbJ